MIQEDNSEFVQMSVVKLILDEAKTGKICIHCKHTMDKIQVLANRIVMISRKKECETLFLKQI